MCLSESAFEPKQMDFWPRLGLKLRNCLSHYFYWFGGHTCCFSVVTISLLDPCGMWKVLNGHASVFVLMDILHL